SRCVWAFTSPGSTTARPSATSASLFPGATETIRPSSSVTTPPSSGASDIGRIQSAEKLVKGSRAGHSGSKPENGQSLPQSQLLAVAASRLVVPQFVGHGPVRVSARRRQRQHAWHVAFAENRLPEDLVMHVPTLGNEPGILDVDDDLELVHAVRSACGAHDVLFDHHAAHVVGAVGEAQLANLPALR